MLTAIITFRNEGDMLADTVASIRETAGSAVSIHLINDGSSDGYDYRAVAERYSCRYDGFEHSRGPAANRNFGADKALTPYVICLDAHMRFYQPDWHDRVIAAIQSDPRALYCTVSRPLKPDTSRAGGADGYGAFLGFESTERLFLAEWNTVPLTHQPYPKIPLPLGATYAFDTEFFKEIGGYVGLQQYGGEEAFAGMKAWMMGGSCRLIRDVTIGHIYRSIQERPWQNNSSCYLFNRMMLVATLMPEQDLDAYFAQFSDAAGYKNAVEIFREQEGFIQNLRHYLQDNKLYDAEYFLDINKAFLENHNLEEYFFDALGECS